MDDETLPAADQPLGGVLVMTVTAEVVHPAEQEDEGEQ